MDRGHSLYLLNMDAHFLNLLLNLLYLDVHLFALHVCLGHSLIGLILHLLTLDFCISRLGFGLVLQLNTLYLGF